MTRYLIDTYPVPIEHKSLRVGKTTGFYGHVELSNNGNQFTRITREGWVLSAELDDWLKANEIPCTLEWDERTNFWSLHLKHRSRKERELHRIMLAFSFPVDADIRKQLTET